MRATATIAELGEFAFLDDLLPRLGTRRGVAVGPGDDCAVVTARGRRLLLTTDALVEGVHFRLAWMSPRQIGRKAYLVNASDIAAMGGRPAFCLVSAGAPADFNAASLRDIHLGIAKAAEETGAAVVGGNLTRARELFVSVTLVGEAVVRPVTRSGAKAGDLLYVTGELGEAALGLRHLMSNTAAAGRAVTRFREPVNRLRASEVLARAAIVSAMIDVSDGLLQDLGHICTASGTGADVEIARLPCRDEVRSTLALSGGEDYELLCAVPRRHEQRIERLMPKLGCRFTRIGRLTGAPGVRILDERGSPVRVDAKGHDHFAGGVRR